MDELFERYCDEEFIRLEPKEKFDKYILGVIEGMNVELVLVYDKNGIITELISDGMSYDEALEYYEYNILGAYWGDKTPLYLDKI